MQFKICRSIRFAVLENTKYVKAIGIEKCEIYVYQNKCNGKT